MSSLKLLKPGAPQLGSPAIPGAEADADEQQQQADTDPRKPARFGLWALAIGLGGFLIFAAFAPLDEGVPSGGQVAINTKRKSVQHPNGGIIKEVAVVEGQHVKEGELLIKLDEAVARANYESIRQQYFTALANQQRLLAEQAGKERIDWPPKVKEVMGDPVMATLVATQEKLFLSRRSSLHASLQGIEESIRGQQALNKSYQEIIVSRRSQLGLINEELVQTRELVKEGYTPRNRQLELERTVSDVNSAIAELLGNIGRGQNAILELRQRAISATQDYRKEVDTQLSDVSKDVQAGEAKYSAVRDDLQRIEIRSPATGQVVGLNVQTVGGVIQGGQRLMDIVPENELLLVETRVLPQYIDRVHADMPVDIRFGTFANSPQLVVDGKVVSVSGDLLTDPQTNQPYYLARVSVTPEGFKKLGHRTMQSGMPVEVVLKTGERTLLTYMLHPLMKRMAASLKEE